MKYNHKLVHISTIRAGDTVLHGGQLKTVCNSNLTASQFMGICLWGDSYNLGQNPVYLISDLKY